MINVNTQELFMAIMGGLMIGMAALLMWWFLGRVTGVSGILWQGVRQVKQSGWRWSFVAGLLLGPLCVHQVFNVAIPELQQNTVYITILAGLLVGFGTHMGSGCTSGHGVCGIGRLSIRSLTATVCFMSAGMLTVFIMRHVL